VHIEAVFLAHIIPHLSDRFEERQAFYITDRAADLNDDYVVAVSDRLDRLFDLIGNMGYDLDCIAEVVAAPLFRDDIVIDLPCCKLFFWDVRIWVNRS